MSQWANESISQSANQPNRDPVVRDQKVFPEVRNRPLLPRDFFSHSTFRNSCKSSRGTFGFTHPMSDIHIRPGWSLRRFRNRRLLCSELHIETDFEIYASGIGVCIYVIQSNPIQSNPFQCNLIQSITHSFNQSINQIKSNQSTNPVIQWNQIE